MNKVYWLASYPKSGNTWTRIFLSNYLSKDDRPVDINRITKSIIASDRDLFDRWAGVESSDLSYEDITDLRPHVYRQMASHLREPLYLKVHDACVRNSEGEIIFPHDITGGVIYIIRNPLDVVVSYAHHNGRSLAQVVETMCNTEGYVYTVPTRLAPQLPQKLLSWSGHVLSWVDGSGLPVDVIRYEDMLAAPYETFTRIIRTLGLSFDAEKLSKALAFSQFDSLQEQEASSPFRERPIKADAPFFRKGRTGGWRDELSQQLADTIINAHKSVMRRFGYLDASDNPIF